MPVRGVRRLPDPRPYLRAPFSALILSLLVLLAPELTLAPLLASQPMTRPQPIDHAVLPPVPRVVPGVLSDDRVAGTVEPVASAVSDAPRYQSALDAARAYAGAYGITFAAVRDGQLLWTGRSGRERDGRTELRPDTPLVIGSVTKTYVAATVLQLVQEGRLDLDAPLRRYLPALRSISDEITIRQLLNHTSGLADVFNDTTRRGLEDHPERAWTADEVLGTLHSPWYQPGEGWAYANTNYYLLGLLVERVTGSTLSDELDRRFLDRFGLDDTHMLTGADGGALSPAWATIFWASGSMSASAGDLARWGDALYRNRVLTRASRKAMLELNSDDYGLGVQRIELPGRVGYGHTGLLNTYTTLLVHLPKDGLTIALLVNRSNVDLGGMLVTKPANGGPSLLELATGS